MYIQKSWKQVSKRYLHIHIHSSIIHSSQEVEAAHVSIDSWMDKEKVVYMYYRILALKRKEVTSQATTWMKLEDIVLSEISQSQKNESYTIPLIWDS